jgi:hypothetical protein
MVGFPNELKTKQDWLNAVSYATLTKDGKTVLINRLLELKNNTTVLVLKASSKDKPSEEQTLDDFERVDDPACEKNRLGFTDVEIDKIIRSLK